METNDRDWDIELFSAITFLLGLVGWVSFFFGGPSPIISMTLLNTDYSVIRMIGWIFSIYEYFCMGIFWLFTPNLLKIFRKKTEDKDDEPYVPPDRDDHADYLRRGNPEYQQAIADNDEVKMKLLEDEQLAWNPTSDEMKDTETFSNTYWSRVDRRDKARKKTLGHSLDISRYTPTEYLRLLPHPDYCGGIFDMKSLDKSLKDRQLWPTKEEFPTRDTFEDLSKLYLKDIFNTWYRGSYENRTDHYGQFEEECFFEFCKENEIQTSSPKLNARINEGAKFYQQSEDEYQFDVPGAVFIYTTLEEAAEYNTYKFEAIEKTTRADAEDFVKTELEGQGLGRPVILTHIEVPRCAHEIVNQLKSELETIKVRVPAPSGNTLTRAVVNWYQMDLDELENKLKTTISEFSANPTDSRK